MLTYRLRLLCSAYYSALERFTTMKPVMHKYKIFMLCTLIALIPNTCLADLLLGNDKEKQESETPQTKQDLSKRYYQQCRRDYHLPHLQDHIRLLCACTSAKMFEKYSLEEATTLFEDTEDGEFQRDRLALHGLIPCLKQPIANITFDRCFSPVTDNPERYNKQQADFEYRACKCLGEEMGEYAIKGKNALRSWGMRSSYNFSADKIPQDAILKLITDSYFEAYEIGQKTSCRQRN